MPDENGASSFIRPSLNPHKYIIADNPVFCVHYVDAGYVVSFCNISRVVAQAFRPVIVKQAVLHSALFRTNHSAILFWNFYSFDSPLPYIVNDAVVDSQLLNIRIGVNLKAIPLDILNGEVCDSNAGASRDSK